MSSPPAAMRANGRHVDDHFPKDETLFRRVPLSIWDDSGTPPGPEAVELPDLSVSRSKYAHPEWARFDTVNHGHFEEWGVLGFLVGDIPPQYWDAGMFKYTFSPSHDPLETDYAHSEVRVASNGARITLSDVLPEDIHLKWRVAFLRKLKMIIKPGRRVQVRETPPRSHLLEPLPDR